MSTPHISVVLAVYNGADRIERQLEALSAQEFTGPWELVIADNGSTDGTRQVCERWISQLPAMRVIDASARRGQAAACNIGVDAARGNKLAFCDDDDRVEPGWLGSLERALDVHDFVGGAFRFPDDPEILFLRSSHYRFLPAAVGANMAMRRQVFEAVGGFTEDLVAESDVDISWRVQLAGYGLHLEKTAVVEKHRRVRLRDAWQQHHAYGYASVQLHARFSKFGASRATRLAMKKYAWILLTVPGLIARQHRAHWVRTAARAWGRLHGSIAERVLYL